MIKHFYRAHHQLVVRGGSFDFDGRGREGARGILFWICSTRSRQRDVPFSKTKR